MQELSDLMKRIYCVKTEPLHPLIEEGIKKLTWQLITGLEHPEDLEPFILPIDLEKYDAKKD